MAVRRASPFLNDTDSPIPVSRRFSNTVSEEAHAAEVAEVTEAELKSLVHTIKRMPTKRAAKILPPKETSWYDWFFVQKQDSTLETREKIDRVCKEMLDTFYYYNEPSSKRTKPSCINIADRKRHASDLASRHPNDAPARLRVGDTSLSTKRQRVTPINVRATENVPPANGGQDKAHNPLKPTNSSHAAAAANRKPLVPLPATRSNPSVAPTLSTPARSNSHEVRLTVLVTPPPETRLPTVVVVPPAPAVSSDIPPAPPVPEGQSQSTARPQQTKFIAPVGRPVVKAHAKMTASAQSNLLSEIRSKAQSGLKTTNVPRTPGRTPTTPPADSVRVPAQNEDDGRRLSMASFFVNKLRTKFRNAFDTPLRGSLSTTREADESEDWE